MPTPLLLCLFLTLGQTEPAPADTPPEPAPAEAPIPAPPAPDRWFLMESLQGTWPGWLLDSQRIQVYGWTEASFTASSAEHEQLPLGLNYRANEFLLQQNWLRVERKVVTSGTTEPTFGFKSDTILPGSDYRFTVARGLLDSQLTANNGQPNPYGIDPIQFYAEAYFPTVGAGLDVKVGRIFCQYGVESADAVSNAFLSHCYTFFYDPFTHTGIMGTLKLTDTWSVQAGIMAGNDVFLAPASTPYGMGSIKWAPPDGRDSVLFSVILGSRMFDRTENFHNPEIFDLVYTHRFTSRLTYSFEGLYGFTTNVPDIGAAEWFGILNYLTCDLAPRLSGSLRTEFFDDPQGQRTGFEGLYLAVTAGLSFKPFRALTLRPELRYDYNVESRPFEDKHGLFTAAADAVLRW